MCVCMYVFMYVIYPQEQICVTLEGGAPCLQVLRSCTLACDPNNVFCRAPTLTAILHLSVDFCVVYGEILYKVM